MENFYSVENIDEPQIAAFYAQSAQSAQNSAQNSGYDPLNSDENPHAAGLTNSQEKNGEQGEKTFNPHDFNIEKSIELIKNNGQLKASVQTEYFKPTNIGFLDEKIKNGTITPMDAYMANKYFGVNLSNYGYQKVDLNAKVKGLGLTGLDGELRMFENNDELFNRGIIGSEEKLGAWDAFWRAIYKGTGGVVNALDKGEAQWMVDVNEMANALARARIGSGRTTDQMRKQAYEDIKAAAKTETSFIEQINSAKKTNLVAWGNAIRRAQIHGLPVDDETIKKYEQAVRSVIDLNDALIGRGEWGKSDYDNYRKYGYTYGAHNATSGQNSQNGEQKQAYRKIELENPTQRQ